MREELIELENVPDEKLELLLNTPGSAIGTSKIRSNRQNMTE